VLPNTLVAKASPATILPQNMQETVASLDGLIAESFSAGKRYIGAFLSVEKQKTFPIAPLPERLDRGQIDFLLEPLQKGESWGLISDAGLACVADPGSKLVFQARKRKIQVQVISGPSSLLLALIHSGFSGNNFAFIGYLPTEERERRKKLQLLEKRMREEKQTQIFIEAPYRNEALLSRLLEELSPEIWLSISVDLHSDREEVFTKTISEWRKSPLPDLKKRLAVFVLAANY
jgi:16S rRNA (cytidine1402-2'-O)-methyltransferase